MHTFRRLFILLPTLCAVVALGAGTAQAQGGRGHGYGGGKPHSFLAGLASSPSISADVTGSNGDANPYGVAVVPNGFPSGGPLAPGDILVSNFNDSAGHQRTGTTIVSVTPSGTVSTFFTAPSNLAPVGLSTALVALRSGIIVVGSTPTTDGTPATISNGGLIFVDKSGNVLLNLTDSALLQGPWDMTADNSSRNAPILYVSNVLSGTITRINLRIRTVSGSPVPEVVSMTQIASGFLHRTDPSALVVGPTGLLLAGSHGRNGGSLYVADTGGNRITLIRDINGTGRDGTGRTVASGGPLEGPLVLAWAPNGDISLPPMGMPPVHPTLRKTSIAWLRSIRGQGKSLTLYSSIRPACQVRSSASPCRKFPASSLSFTSTTTAPR